MSTLDPAPPTSARTTAPSPPEASPEEAITLTPGVVQAVDVLEARKAAIGGPGPGAGRVTAVS